MPTVIHQRVRDAQQGQNPNVICRVPSGWVVLGDVQFLRGYCLLLPDPVVPDLNALAANERARFLYDMARVGDILLKITGAARINYEILGNTERALHAHLFPRYDTEPDDLRRMPVWFYDWKNAVPFEAERDKELMRQIAQALTQE